MNDSQNLIDNFRGIIPSLHTPFTADNLLDLMSVRRLVDRTVDAGCVGTLIGAVAGESANLSVAEKRQLIETVVEQTADRIQVIAGISSDSAEGRLSLARAAHAAGAQWILCQPPAQLHGEELVSFFEPLCEHGPENLMVQDLSWADAGMPLDDILLLHERLPTFRSLKIEVVPSGPKYTQVLQTTNHQLHVCGGWAIMGMIESMHRGVHAFVPSTMDGIYTRIYQLFQAGEEEQARTLFEQIIPVLAFTHQHIHISIAFSKLLRVREGVFSSDHCRPPINVLDVFQRHEAERWIDRIMRLEADLH